MTDRPILFSAPMVLAILDGRKTQTRRIIKDVIDTTEISSERAEHYDCLGYVPMDERFITPPCRHGRVGDRLWVRENFARVPASAYRMSEGVQQTINPTDPDEAAIYAAGWDRSIPRWKPSIHMPRWASRITLEITGVRVERLQQITTADIYAEGAVTEDWLNWREDVANIGMPPGSSIETERNVWEHLWNSINGEKHPWESNPWVWAVEFKRVVA